MQTFTPSSSCKVLLVILPTSAKGLHSLAHRDDVGGKGGWSRGGGGGGPVRSPWSKMHRRGQGPEVVSYS